VEHLWRRRGKLKNGVSTISLGRLQYIRRVTAGPTQKTKTKSKTVVSIVTTEEIQAETRRLLDTLKEKDFQESFQKWRRRWDQCLHAGGTYFETDDGR
jgi:hypothetical protein